MSYARLLGVGLRNFQSYGNNFTYINLDFRKPVLIQGRNLDSAVDGQVDSNGSGKSTILIAILYALYGKVPDSDVKVNALINNINNKNMYVVLDIEKAGVFYRIERFRKLEKRDTGICLLRKYSADEAWDHNDEKQNITNAGRGVEIEIERIIGLPFEITTRIVSIIASHEPFLKLSLDKQRDIIEELFGFKELSEKAELLKQKIKDNNKDLESLQKLDEQIKREIERHTALVVAAEKKISDWEANKATRVHDIEAKIETHNLYYGKVDYDAEETKFVDIQELDQGITTVSNEITTHEKEIVALNGKVKDINSWEDKHTKEVESLKVNVNKPLKFKTLADADYFQTKIQGIETNITNADSAIVVLDKTLVDRRNEIKLLTNELSNNDKLLIQQKTKLADIEHEITHLTNSKCPYCSQAYETSKDKLSERNSEHTKVTESINTINLENEQINNTITSINEVIEVIVKDKEVAANNRTAFKAERSNLFFTTLGSASADFKTEYQKTINHQSIINELALKEKETNPFSAKVSLDELNEMKASVQESINEKTKEIEILKKGKQKIISSLVFKQFKEIATAKFTIQSLTTELERVSGETNPHLETLEELKNNPPSETKGEAIQKLHDAILHQDFLLKLLTKKDSFIRKALVNRYIPFLNTAIKKYLSKLGMPHKVEFQQDMTVKITQFRSEIKFSSLSSGQKARVNLALSFAFRDVLQSRFGNINFCILDECLDTGLGNVGVQLATKMIKSIANDNGLSMFVISHRDEITSMFDSRLVVELKNGFSSIVHSDI
jgi:DNA repair exonuclease SbcCD ATPase subunit